MDIDDVLRGDWYEFSGGSRPGNKGIRFLKRGKSVVIELFYAFDSTTGESEFPQWKLPAKAFDRLAEALVSAGYGVFERAGEDSLRFERGRSPPGFESKLKGRHTDPIVGGRAVEFTGYRQVPCGVLAGGTTNSD